MGFYAAQVNRHVLLGEKLAMIANYQTRRPEEKDAELRKREKISSEQINTELIHTAMMAAIIYILRYLFDGDTRKHYRLMKSEWELRYSSTPKTHHVSRQYGDDSEDEEGSGSSEDSVYDEAEKDEAENSSEDEAERLAGIVDGEVDNATIKVRAIGLDMERILREQGMIWFPANLIEWDRVIPHFKSRILGRIAFNIGGGFGSDLQHGMGNLNSISAGNSVMMVIKQMLTSRGKTLFGAQLHIDQILTVCAKVCIAKYSETFLSIIYNHHVTSVIARKEKRLGGQRMHKDQRADIKTREDKKWHQRLSSAERMGLYGVCPAVVARILQYDDASELIKSQGVYSRKGRVKDNFYADGTWVNKVFALFNFARANHPDPYAVVEGDGKSGRAWHRMEEWRTFTEDIYELINTVYGQTHADWFIDVGIKHTAPRFILILPKFEPRKFLDLVDHTAHLPLDETAYRIKFITPVFESVNCTTRCQRVCTLHNPEKALFLNITQQEDLYPVRDHPLNTDTNFILAGKKITKSLTHKTRCRHNTKEMQNPDDIYVITNAKYWGDARVNQLQFLQPVSMIFDRAKKDRKL